MVFKDREQAGRLLAEKLKHYADLARVVVQGIPRGGIPVAFEISRALNAPLDLFLCTKLGVPGEEELAFGAIAADDGRFLDEQVIRSSNISEADIERISRDARLKLKERAFLYRGHPSPLNVRGRIVILVDDGIATGASMYASIHALRKMGAEKLIVAVPVACSSSCIWLSSLVEELICLYNPDYFKAVGEFYDDFSQVSDSAVMDRLRRAKHQIRRADC